MNHHEIYPAVYTIHLRLHRLLIRMLKPYALTPAQLSVLNALWIKDHVPLRFLSCELQLDCATLSGIVSRLTKAGWIQKKTNPDDQREMMIRLTPKAKQFQGTGKAILKQLEDHLTRRISDKDKAGFFQLLNRIENEIQDIERSRK